MDAAATSDYLVRQFLSRNKLFCNGKDPAVTHTLMNGSFGYGTNRGVRGMNTGAFILPVQHRAEFYAVLRDSSVPPLHYFISELRVHETFSFFLDFDYVAKAPLSVALAKMITTMTLDFFSKTFYAGTHGAWKLLGAVYVSLCSEATPVKARPGFVKTGLHMTFGSLIVNEERAVLLAKALTYFLQLHFSHDSSHDPWNKIIDLGVYGLKKGLRLYGSSKLKDCEACTKKRGRDGTPISTTCDACGNTRHVLDGSGRRYQFVFALDGSGQLHPNNACFQSDFIKAIRCCSIQSLQHGLLTMPFEPPPFCSEPEFLAMAAAPGGRARGSYTGLQVPSSDERVKALQAFIRGLHVEWNGLVLTGVMERNSGPPNEQLLTLRLLSSGGRAPKSQRSWTCKAVGAGCKYCLNVGRHHTSNTIHFVIGPRGVVQHCFSTKPSLGVPCKKFRSHPFALPATLQLDLFPLQGTGAAGADMGGSMRAPISATFMRKKLAAQNLCLGPTLPPPTFKQRDLLAAQQPGPPLDEAAPEPDEEEALEPVEEDAPEPMEQDGEHLEYLDE